MKYKIWIKISAIFILLFVLLALLYVLSKENRHFLTVYFLNIGQGDSIFIEAPNGNQILLDGGPSRSVLRELGAVLPFYDRSIDVVIASHADQDHVGGLPHVLNSYNIGLFVEPGVSGKSSSYEELEKIVENKTSKKEITKILARAPMVIDLGAGVLLQVLFPDIDPTGMETNESSIVARLVYGESEFLLTGDAPISTERYLISKKIDIESDVLKAGHHGSRTSTSDAFVKMVKPKIAVISAGKDNKFGHPHSEVLDILKNNGVQIKSTITEGRIKFESDGVDVWVD